MMNNLKPYWTDQAIRQMKEIYDFYKTFGKKTIQNRISPIKRQVERLTHFPYLGKVEACYQETEYFRSLIEGDYKIIYLIREERIYIVAIFDCRQNPSNLYTMLKL